jgi:U3 small nucleolar RNA-associated protein MPP10
MAAVARSPSANCDMLTNPHQHLISVLSSSSHGFLQPTSALHAAAVLAAKRYLDPLASSISEVQEAQRRENKRKRKRAGSEADRPGKVLKLREVYTEGFGISQIWEQAKRILDATTDEVERDLEKSQASQGGIAGSEEEPQHRKDDTKKVHFDEDGPDMGSGQDEEILEAGLALREGHLWPEEGGGAEGDDDEEMAKEDLESIRGSEEYSEAEERPQVYVPDPNGLNDGFFSIDDFNKQSQFLEQQDAMGEEDQPSDEDEIDWDANPLATPLPRQAGNKQLETDDATDSEVEDGPTFGDADLDADSDDGKDEDLDSQDGMPGLDNTNDIHYADFFEPPAQKPSKSKRRRALPKTQPPPRPSGDETSLQELDDDIQRAISDVRRDLLDSEDEPSLSDQDDNTADQQAAKSPATGTKNLSTHEKQRAKIAAEIRRLEAAAISKRDWTLSGEARAADRPLNSLIEEDLQFERAGKPVPVITAEVSEEIEALIKRRIVAREFDEVVRRRPEALASAATARRGRVEIDDTRPSQGLAAVYEAEHLKATDPGYVDKRSAALKKQHAEISRLWKDVSAKLDVLSNLHFKPKRAEVSVQLVADQPTISMEDARPGAAEGGGADSMLAPQEIYAPGGKEGVKGEVMGKGGLARSKEEMTKVEKVRKRRRDKERAKKQKGSDAVVVQQQQQQQQGLKRGGRHADKLQEKRNILDELRKGGVKVIGKRGDVEEIDGKKRKRGQSEVVPRSTAYKL